VARRSENIVDKAGNGEIGIQTLPVKPRSPAQYFNRGQLLVSRMFQTLRKLVGKLKEQPLVNFTIIAPYLLS